MTRNEETESEDEREPNRQGGSLAERLSMLEQWKYDHIRMANRNFKRIEDEFKENTEAHQQLSDHLDVQDDLLKEHMRQQKELFSKYNWAARMIMTIALISGAFIGLIIHPTWESLRLFFHFLWK